MSPEAVAPDFMREPGTVAFHRELFIEQSQEGGFLYEQRVARLVEGEQSWLSLQPLEDRLAARIDALVAGQELGLRVCAQRVQDGDPGEVFMGLSVACQHAHAPAMARILNAVDLEAADRMAAARDALCWHWPAAWEGFIERALQGGTAQLVALLAPVCGRRQLPLGPTLLRAWQAHPGLSLPMLDALGHLRVREALPWMRRALTAPTPDLQAAGMLALLRLGDDSPLQCDAQQVAALSWSHPLLGLAGAPSHALALLAVARAGQATASTLHALGLLGDPVAFDVLCDHLGHPELGAAAALALRWMTGADLADTRFVPEAVDEDALLPDELRAWREGGQPPQHADGRPYGEQHRAWSRHPDRWRSWRAEHSAGMVEGQRQRFGQPVTPTVLVDTLMRPDADLLLRHYTAMELSLRHGLSHPFDVGLPVSEQWRQLTALKTWAATACPLPPGAWCFDGRAQ